MYKISLCVVVLVMLTVNIQSQLIISQYAEDGNIKGIEIWNNSGADITLDDAAHELIIEVFFNGSATPSSTFTFGAASGLIFGSNDVLVFADGSANTIWTTSGIPFTETNLSFNGDDAIRIHLGGVVQDIFGTIGSDPGSHWSGGGVDTETANLALIEGLIAGDVDGWADPSARFINIEQGLLDDGSGGDLSGFGFAPIPEPSSCILFVLGLVIFYFFGTCRGTLVCRP